MRVCFQMRKSGAGQWRNQFQDCQHLCQVHRIRQPGRAVEHHLGDVIPHAKFPGVIGRQECRHHKDHIRRIAHAPVMRLVQFHRNVALAVPGHHLLMLADRAFQIPGSAPVHLVEPEERDGAPGVVDGLDIHFRAAG